MIKYITLQTWKQSFEPENKEPSLTRVSDFESIESMFSRFLAQGAMIELFKPISQLSPEEKDVLYNGTDLEDLADEDISVQKEFLDDQHRKLSDYLPESEDNVKKEAPTQTKSEPENPATEPEDA